MKRLAAAPSAFACAALALFLSACFWSGAAESAPGKPKATATPRSHNAATAFDGAGAPEATPLPAGGLDMGVAGGEPLAGDGETPAAKTAQARASDSRKRSGFDTQYVPSGKPSSPAAAGDSLLPVFVSVAGDLVVLVVLAVILYLMKRNVYESFGKLEADARKISTSLDNVKATQNATAGRAPGTDEILRQIESLRSALQASAGKARETGASNPSRPAYKSAYAAGAAGPDYQSDFLSRPERPGAPVDGSAKSDRRESRQSLESALRGPVADVLRSHPLQLVLARAGLGHEDLFEERADGPFVGYRERDVVLVVPASPTLQDADHFNAQLACLFDCAIPTRGEIHLEAPARLQESEYGRYRKVGQGRISIP